MIIANYEATARRLYPLDKWDREHGLQFPDLGVRDYGPIIHRLGTVRLRVDECLDGTIMVLYENGDRWGTLMWDTYYRAGGDPLERCNSYGDVGEVIKEIEADVQWWTRKDLLAKLCNEPAALMPNDGEMCTKFVGKAIGLLRAKT